MSKKIKIQAMQIQVEAITTPGFARCRNTKWIAQIFHEQNSINKQTSMRRLLYLFERNRLAEFLVGRVHNLAENCVRGA